MHLDPENHSHSGKSFPPNFTQKRYIETKRQIIPKDIFDPQTQVFCVENLSFAYAQKNIIDNVSFSLTQGELCGILGPNGSGKSTLFKCCMNFVPIKQGNISCFNENIKSTKVKNFAKKVAYVPQNDNTSFTFKVHEIIEMGRSPHRSILGLTNKDYAAIESAMENLGVAHLAKEYYHTLSGGQKQMVLIARAIAQESPLIFLDEPTSSLDFHNQIMVWNTLKSLTKKGATILVCCHDPNHILWFCDKVLCLKSGKLIAHGDPIDTLKNPILQHMFGDSCTISNVENVPVVHPRFFIEGE